MNSFISKRGLWSYGQVEGQLAERSLETLFSVTGEKEEKSGGLLLTLCLFLSRLHTNTQKYLHLLSLVDPESFRFGERDFTKCNMFLDQHPC